MKAFYLSILMALALLPAHAQRRYNAMRETKKEFSKQSKPDSSATRLSTTRE